MESASRWLAKLMKSFLALLIFCSSCALAHGQSLASKGHSSPRIIENATADQVVAAQAILLLKRLDDDVIVYRSLEEFEQGRKLSRVPFETFNADLQDVSAEVEAAVSRLGDTRLKMEIAKALAGYREGAFWWQKIYQPRGINVLEMRLVRDETSDSFFVAGIPYIVMTNWRQANEHLQRAVRDLGIE